MKKLLALILACTALSSHAATYFFNAWTTNNAPTVTNVTLSLITNYFATNMAVGTNYLFVNPTSGDDSTAIPGRPDKAWLKVTNAIIRASTQSGGSNQFVVLFPGYYADTANAFGISNNITLIGMDKTLCRIGGAIGTEPTVQIFTNATLANVNGYFLASMARPGGNVSSINATGKIDAGTVGVFGTNTVIRDSIFNVIGGDSTNILLDAFVISTGRSNRVTILNSWFISEGNQAYDTNVLAGSMRRGIVWNGGDVYMQGGGISVNNNYLNFAIHGTGSTDSGSKFVFQDVNFKFSQTNFQGSLAVAISNVNMTFAAIGSVPFKRSDVVGSIIYSNSVAGTNLLDPAPGYIVTNGNANLSARVQVGNGARGVVDAAASGAVPVNADGTATTFAQVNALAPSAIVTNAAPLGRFDASGASNNWVMTPLIGGVFNVQLQNANRFAAPIGGNGGTNLIQLVGVPLPSGGYLSNLMVRCSTNNFSTTNYTFTLLTNNAAANPVPSPVASLLTGTLLGVTANAQTNFSGVSCILPARSATVDTFGVMQILNSVANTTQPQSFTWRIEWWHQQFNP